MKNLRLALVAAAGILALSSVSVAQVVPSSNCPPLRVTKEKITEDQARNLAQQYADKNLDGFKVVRPGSYGGGYNTVCYQKDSAGKVQTFYSVEYSIDAINSAGDSRILRVDQFGSVTEFTGIGTASR